MTDLSKCCGAPTKRQAISNLGNTWKHDYCTKCGKPCDVNQAPCDLTSDWHTTVDDILPYWTDGDALSDLLNARKQAIKAAGDRSIEAAKREEFNRIKAEAEAFCGYGYSAKYAITEEMHNFFSALESGESFLSPKKQ